MQSLKGLLRTPKGITTNKEIITNLGQWFQDVFQVGWQSVDTLLNTESGNLALGFRKHKVEVGEFSASGIKAIDLGMQLGNQSVALLIGLIPENEQKMAIRVQLHPVGGNIYLPGKIKLALLSRSGKVLQEIQAPYSR